MRLTMNTSQHHTWLALTPLSHIRCRVPLLTVGLLGLGLLACDEGRGCTLEYVPGIRVTVMGGAAQAAASGGQGGEAPTPECAAQVMIEDGDYSEQLECSAGEGEGANCQCWGAGERAGKYTVTVSLHSQEATQTVTVQGGACHVRTEELTFFEEPD